MSDFTYEKVGKTYNGLPVYLVTDAATGDRLGVIEACVVSTDTQIAGTRLRRPGKGRRGFRPAAWLRYDRKTDTETWSITAHYRHGDDTRDAAAANFRTGSFRKGPMPADIIDQLIGMAAER